MLRRHIETTAFIVQVPRRFASITSSTGFRDNFCVADPSGRCARLTNHVFGAAPGRISLASGYHTYSVRTNAEVPVWNHHRR